MSSLFSKQKAPEVKDPVEMPDDEDILAQRKRRRGVASGQSGGQASTRTSSGTFNTGREYTRGTLG